MIHWFQLPIPIWLPTSGHIAFWFTCGGMALMPMMLFYIRENSHRQYMLLAHGARQDPVGMSMWSILKILLAGPVSLALGIIVTFYDQPKRHREAPRRQQDTLNALLP